MQTLTCTQWVIECEGSQLPSVWQRAGNIVEMGDIRTNDIHMVLKTYGVEMARRTIVDEVSGVFGGYNIDVDRRHLELIADYMVRCFIHLIAQAATNRVSQTFEGGYKPFNRTGIATNSSPLLKASFETTVAFITDATLHGDFDDLTSPAGNIIVGRLAQTGTGSFDVLMPIHAKKNDFETDFVTVEA